MIRGPVLPHLRDSLWALVSTRLDRIETGLSLVLEALDCSDGELGVVEGLARDATGGAVLVMLAIEGDALLPARALAAGQFLARVGDALVRAVPEANFCPGVPGRILLVGTDATASAIEYVCTLPIARLHACTLEPFRVAGSERFAVRWLSIAGRGASDDSVAKSGAASAGALAAGAMATGSACQAQAEPHSTDPQFVGLHHPSFVVPPSRADIWQALLSICERVDNGVTVCGDRFSQRICWNGNLLGEVRTVGAGLIATAATGVVRDLRSLRDVRHFADQLLRAFVYHAEIDLGDGLAPGLGGDRPASKSHVRNRRVADNESTSGHPAAVPAGEDARLAATRHAAGDSRNLPNGESLRSSLAAAKLSPEEYSALGDPASVAGSISEGSVAKDRS